MPVKETHIESRASDDPGTLGDHHFDQIERLACDAAVLLRAGVLQPRRGQELLEGLGGAFHDNHVALSNHFVASRARKTLTTTNQAKEIDIVIVGHLLELA